MNNLDSKKFVYEEIDEENTQTPHNDKGNAPSGPREGEKKTKDYDRGIGR
jgi:hypothetical protein